MTLTVPKIVYTALLLSVVLLFVAEIVRLWVDRGVYIRAFAYFEDGSAKPEKGGLFALRVIDLHAYLRRRFAEAELTDLRDDRILTPRAGPPIRQSASVLTEVDLVVQKINITDILSSLRRWVSSPNEVTGTVARSGGLYRASLTLSKVNQTLADGSFLGRSVHVDGLSSEHEAAFALACRMIWAEAAKSQVEIARVPQEEFCHWSSAWSEYLGLRSRARSLGGLAPTDVAKLLGVRESLTRRIEAGVIYAKYYALRADVVDLLPAEERAPHLVEAQNDRLRYAELLDLDTSNGAVQAKLTDKQALEQMARVRPAIHIQADAATGVSDEWKEILDPAQAAVQAVARATGVLRIESEGAEGHSSRLVSGFVVAPNVVATVDEALPKLAGAAEGFPKDLPEDCKIDFTFSDGGFDAGAKAYRVKRILFRPDADSENQLALLEVEAYDTQDHPAVRVDTQPDDQSTRGRYVAVIGYPEQDPQLPKDFVGALLGGTSGTKRLLPGRIVAAASDPVSKNRPEGEGKIVSDVSSTLGTPGGPLVDLSTGEVIGVHVSGAWKGLRAGKFAFAQPLSAALRDPKISPEVRKLLVPVEAAP